MNAERLKCVRNSKIREKLTVQTSTQEVGYITKSDNKTVDEYSTSLESCMQDSGEDGGKAPNDSNAQQYDGKYCMLTSLHYCSELIFYLWSKILDKIG